MALSQSALSELLDAIHAGRGEDTLRDAMTLVLQELIELEADQVIGFQVNTRDATPQANDPDCASGPDNPTVWYAFTPGSNGTYGASTFGSDDDTTLWVGTAANGGLNEIACNDDAVGVQSAVIWEATAGTQLEDRLRGVVFADRARQLAPLAHLPGRLRGSSIRDLQHGF